VDLRQSTRAATAGSAPRGQSLDEEERLEQALIRVRRPHLNTGGCGCLRHVEKLTGLRREAIEQGRQVCRLADVGQFPHVPLQAGGDIAESTGINLVNDGEVQDKHFLRRNSGVTLTAEGRKKVIQAYERRLEATVVHPVFRYKISYRRVLDVQVRIIAAVMLGELETYTPMVTR